MGKKMKLTDANVRWIRRNSGKLGIREMARRMNCSPIYVSHIVRGIRRASADLSAIRGVPIHFEPKGKGPPSTRCWNNPFWYGGSGELATVESVIISRADYRALRRAALKSPEKQA